MFGGYGSLLCVLYYGSVLVSRGHLSVGSLTSFAMYSATVGLGFSGISQVYSETSKALSSAQRVFEVLETIPSIDQEHGSYLAHVIGKLDLVDVHFAYPSRPDAAVLQGLSIHISPGEVVALAGASGVGKSTVAALLTRMYEPTRGSLLLDDVDISLLSPTWLRQQIAVVSQDPVLFAASILDNILYGDASAPSERCGVCLGGAQKAGRGGIADEDARRARAEKAAAEANAKAFIDELPEGYGTAVGERGTQLSGGQRQRVAIARAMLRDPRILVLDEATSALDFQSEHLVREALVRLMRGRTTLVIAHRTSTIASADRVVVIEGGVAVEEGAYTDLCERGDGVLARLVETLPQ